MFFSIRIQTQCTKTSIWREEWWLSLAHSSSIPIIDVFRCCVKSVCTDTVTGRLSGVISVSWEDQQERELKRSVYLDLMIIPVVCIALPPVSHSGTITNRLNSLYSADPVASLTQWVQNKFTQPLYPGFVIKHQQNGVNVAYCVCRL